MNGTGQVETEDGGKGRIHGKVFQEGLDSDLYHRPWSRKPLSAKDMGGKQIPLNTGRIELVNKDHLCEGTYQGHGETAPGRPLSRPHSVHGMRCVRRQGVDEVLWEEEGGSEVVH